MLDSKGHPDLKIAFEQRLMMVPLSDLLLLRQVPPSIKMSMKYKRIAKSIAEVGIIEPLMIAIQPGQKARYLLLDGYMRREVLVDMGAREARCLLSYDDESYTFNKRVNRLSTIQEHFMIVRALERGVPEEKLANALNINIQSVVRRRTMLNGICAEVVNLLKDKSFSPTAFEVIRKMKPARQIEAAELMLAAGNFSSTYAKSLLAATRQSDLVRPDQAKRVDGMTPDQMARMEREMASLQKDYKTVEATYGNDVLNLVIASGYVARLVGNSKIQHYLQQHQPEILQEFRAIISAVSLEHN